MYVHVYKIFICITVSKFITNHIHVEVYTISCMDHNSCYGTFCPQVMGPIALGPYPVVNISVGFEASDLRAHTVWSCYFQTRGPY